jgi:hypothetical protein
VGEQPFLDGLKHVWTGRGRPRSDQLIIPNQHCPILTLPFFAAVPIGRRRTA